MRSLRSILDEDILSLKGATDACLKLGGGVTSFAQLTRVSVSVLSRYADCRNCDPDDREGNFERLIPVDVAVEADRRAGKPLITEEMARQLGYRLEPALASAVPARRITDGDILDMMQEAADVVRELRAARADGRIDSADRKRVRTEIRELQRELEEILVNLAEG
ncbi:phage regulatory CII family protein [Rhizobium sp. CSW-27]|uniref:phage regulatory CII family protein n=1 Tax=Rhizobium sp. CSW-27 TaxID=2839985 RepID=UPI00338D892F